MSELRGFFMNMRSHFRNEPHDPETQWAGEGCMLCGLPTDNDIHDI